MTTPVAGAYEEDADVRDPFDTREFYELCQTYRHSRDYGPIGSPALVVEAFEAVKDFGKRAVARSISDAQEEIDRWKSMRNFEREQRKGDAADSAYAGRMQKALEEIRDLFDGEADASCEPGDDRYRPNRAMQVDMIINAALSHSSLPVQEK